MSAAKGRKGRGGKNRKDRLDRCVLQGSLVANLVCLSFSRPHTRSYIGGRSFSIMGWGLRRGRGLWSPLLVAVLLLASVDGFYHASLSRPSARMSRRAGYLMSLTDKKPSRRPGGAGQQHQHQDHTTTTTFASAPSVAAAAATGGVRVEGQAVPDVLAPAGGREQFLAALNSGADAVFLGLKTFNARARAENFGLSDMEELVPLAHHYGMKVLVTVNVLIKEGEIGALIDTLSALEALEVDAIIVQDQGVGAIARAHFPRLRLHASTQMAVHNTAGVVKAAQLGYRQVVLARELTSKELKDIRSEVPPEVTQLEAFCHGSLCYSYSGLCFFSGANDARSGNRGECAYTCRQPYQIKSEKGYGFLFSMMDLDTSHDLAQLVQAGVSTLKIEGRKKDAQFVTSTVQLYRKRLDDIYGYPTLRPSAPQTARSLASTFGQSRPDQHRQEEGQQATFSRDEAAIREDLALSFHRGRTTFFLKGRYHEKDVIDLDNAGHLGLLAGQVESVSPDGRYLRVLTEVPLDKYDGVKVVPPSAAFYSTPQHGTSPPRDEEEATGLETLHQKYVNQLPEFSVRGMRLVSSSSMASSGGAGKSSKKGGGGGSRSSGSKRQQQPHGSGLLTYEVDKGMLIDVEVPNDLAQRLASSEHRRPIIKPGDLLYKTRSNSLKQRTQAISVAPPDYKLRPWRTVDVTVDVVMVPAGAAPSSEVGGEGRVRVVVRVSKLGEAILEDDSLEVPLEWAQAQGIAGSEAAGQGDVLAGELARLFGVYGDAGIRAHAVEVRGLPSPPAPSYHIPRRELKALKQRVAARIDEALTTMLEARKDAAKRALGVDKYYHHHQQQRQEGGAGRSWEDRRFAIKIDRLEYLDTIEIFWVTHMQHQQQKEGQEQEAAAALLLEEVVFEPKRAFLLQGEDAESGVARLRAFEQRTGIAVRLAFPTVIREWDEAPIRAWTREFAKQQQGQAAAAPLRFEVGNLGALGLLERWGVASSSSSAPLDLASDFPMYALNSEASRVWADTLGIRRIALSIEDDAINLRNHLNRWPSTAATGGAGEEEVGASPQAILYLDSPLFMAEACSLTALHGGCPGSKVCGYRTLEIENEDGEQYYVAHEQCKSVVYGKRAYSIAHRQADLLDMGVRDFKVAFVTRPYSREAMTSILASTLLRHQLDTRPLPDTHSANYDRQLL